MLHIVKIPNNEGDINNMRKFILGLSFLGFGDIGFLIVFTYTLFHQSIINGSEGWLINLIANDTLIPVVFFSLEMGAQQLMLRLVSSMTRIKYSALRYGELEDDDWTKLASFMNQSEKQKIVNL